MEGDPTNTKRIAELHRVLALLAASAPAHQVLGVPHNADAKTARDAWLQLARLLHPDQAVFHKEGLRQEATRAVQGINGAHQEMSKPDYARTVGAAKGSNGSAGAQGRADGQASEELFKRARAMVAGKRWQEAETALEAGKRAGPLDCDGRCEALLGWVIYNNPTRSESVRAADAKAALQKVLDGGSGPRGRAMAHHYLALILQGSGDIRAAQEHLTRCLAIDPQHREAASLQRILQRRTVHGGAPRSRGLWQRLFGARS